MFVFIKSLQVYIQMMNRDKQTIASSTAQLNIIKALEFAGDNSTYQKKRLLLASIIILSLAILTSKMPFMGPHMMIIYLVACGCGQFISIIYFSVRQIALFLFISALLASIFYPFSQFLLTLSYLGIGFFAKGLFGKTLIYINQIGGERFKAWSIIVIFAIWGLSTLISAMQRILNIPIWIWYYGLIFIPMMVTCYYIILLWKRSPYEYYEKKMYKQAKEVLNDIAQQNQRPPLHYCLEGQSQYDPFLQSKKPTYFQIVYEPILRKITIPLIIIWVFKEYVYYGSFTVIPELSNQYYKNYILISISQTLAVLMSYPIRLKIRRINAIFSLILIIGISSLVSSFSVVPQECMPKDHKCSTKYIYRISIMLIRFSIALIGNILINYTLQIYPSNVKNQAFAFFVSISSFGSILFPWIGLAFIHAGYSGFILFAVTSLISLYYITQLTQTYGQMRTEKLQELDKKSVMIPLDNFKNLHF